MSVRAPGLMEITDAPKTEREELTSSGVLSTIAIALLALALLGAIVYLAYQIFAKPAPAPVGNGSAATSSAPGGSSNSFIHQSPFKIPADNLLSLTVDTTAQNAADLKTYTQELKDVVDTDHASAFMEISVAGADGRNLTANDMLSAVGTIVWAPGFLADHFSPDPTVFAYRDKNGIWPGYVFKLKPGENWLFVKNDAAQLEGSSAIESFFIASPGNKIAGGFKDVLLGGEPARSVLFTSGASFVYGWSGGYLIVSTSGDGFTEALKRL